MTVAIYVTKIEIPDPERAVVSLVIDCDLGQLQLELGTEPLDGDTREILNATRKRLERFGQELLDVTATNPLRLRKPPPQSKK
jgi:hypothetical protein